MERSVATSATLQVAGAVAALAVGAYLYYRWLNLPITVAIPERLPTPSDGFDALTAAASLLIDEESLYDALATKPSEGVHLYSAEEKAALLDANTAALRVAREALLLEYSNPARADGNGYHPEFAKFRSLTQLFALDSQTKANRGDYGGAVDASIDAVEIAVKIPRGGPLIPEMIGITCESTGAYPIWRQIDKLDAPAASSAATRLEGVMARRYPFADTLRMEKLSGQANYLKEFRDTSTFAALNNLFDSFALPNEADQIDTSKGKGRNHNEGLGMPLWVLLWAHSSLLLRSKRRIFADYSAMMDAYIEQAEKPFAARGADVRIPIDTFNQMIGKHFKPPRFRHLQMRMNGGLLVCALALRAHCLQYGRYPNRLSDLTDRGILASVPDDPFAPANGTPFRYQCLNDESYLLYSVGPDGIDDNGTPIDLASKPDQWRRRLEATDVGDWVVGVNIGPALGVAKPG